jgi:hypothetical protein
VFLFHFHVQRRLRRPGAVERDEDPPQREAVGGWRLQRAPQRAIVGGGVRTGAYPPVTAW